MQTRLQSYVLPLPEGALRKGLQNPRKGAQFLLENWWAPVDELVTRYHGWFPFEHEWDLLVILDALRFDIAMHGVDNKLWGTPECIWSVGASSPRWIDRTFLRASKSDLNQTAYVSGNPFTDRAPRDELAYVDNVLDYGFDEDLGTVPPEVITDRTISAMREGSASRYIVHYMQPHLPSVEDTGEFTDFISEDINPWEGVEEGDIDPDTVETAYRENLETVVQEVESLLENVDADRVLITADHGNFLGERSRWGHRFQNSTHPAVREVPLWQTRATDLGTRQPNEYNQENPESNQEERLKALGYI